MLIRKNDLIAMLQAIEGNPLVVIEKDGGPYWGTYHVPPNIEIEKVYALGKPADNVEPVLFVGHPGDTTGDSKFVGVEDDENRYLVLK
jgi:hypothetical protein